MLRRRVRRAPHAARPAGGLSRHARAEGLGSERLAAWTNQTLVSEEAYAPFGEAYSPFGYPYGPFQASGAFPIDQFAGATSSVPGGDESLLRFPYRLYQPVEGRWLSPDPSGLAAVNPANPQSWNAYAYVGDQPLMATDPLGLSGNADCGPAPGTQPSATVIYTCDEGGIVYGWRDVNVASTLPPGLPLAPPSAIGGMVAGVGEGLGFFTNQMVAGLSIHPNSPGPSGSWNNGNGVIAAAMAVPQGNSCSELRRVAGGASQYAESVSHAAGWTALGAGIGSIISGALEVPTAGTDTPATAFLVSASAVAGDVSLYAGAAGAVLKSYANGNYSAMGSFDWKHLAADATYLASTQIPGVSKYAEQLAQLADVGLDISVSSPLRCQ